MRKVLFGLLTGFVLCCVLFLVVGAVYVIGEF